MSCGRPFVKDRFANDYYPGGMNELESRPLRYFLAVAEELNFTRGAERLGIAAPALSRAIGRLEAQLGVRLFERSTRRVELTDAGDVLLDQARVALEALEAARRRTQRAAAPGRPLVLALKVDLDGGLLGPSLEAYAREQVGVEIEVRFCRFGEQPQLLREGHADVALLYTPFDERGLDFEPLQEEAQIVAIASGHPLAAQSTVTLPALEAHFRQTVRPHLWLTRPAAGAGQGRLPAAAAAAPEPPPIGDFSQLLKLIEIGQLVALLPASVTTRYRRPQIAYRPAAGVGPATLAVAWPRTSTSLATAAFVRAAAAVAAPQAAVFSARSG